jgi:hypothetical protein
MRLRKLIVLGALALFVSGISSCSKKTDNATTDSTTTTTTTTAPATPPPPPPPAPDTSAMNSMKKDTAQKAVAQEKTAIKKDMKMEKK